MEKKLAYTFEKRWAILFVYESGNLKPLKMSRLPTFEKEMSFFERFDRKNKKNILNIFFKI